MRFEFSSKGRPRYNKVCSSKPARWRKVAKERHLRSVRLMLSPSKFSQYFQCVLLVTTLILLGAAIALGQNNTPSVAQIETNLTAALRNARHSDNAGLIARYERPPYQIPLSDPMWKAMPRLPTPRYGGWSDREYWLILMHRRRAILPQDTLPGAVLEYGGHSYAVFVRCDPDYCQQNYGAVVYDINNDQLFLASTEQGTEGQQDTTTYGECAPACRHLAAAMAFRARALEHGKTFFVEPYPLPEAFEERAEAIIKNYYEPQPTTKTEVVALGNTITIQHELFCFDTPEHLDDWERMSLEWEPGYTPPRMGEIALDGYLLQHRDRIKFIEINGPWAEVLVLHGTLETLPYPHRILNAVGVTCWTR